jgi:hypothetical protein
VSWCLVRSSSNRAWWDCRSESFQKPEQETQTVLLSYERRGIVLGMRMHDAVERAFEQYQKSQPRAVARISEETKRRRW